MDPLVAAIDQGTSSTRFLVSFSEVSLFSCCVQGPGAAGTADYGDSVLCSEALAKQL